MTFSGRPGCFSSLNEDSSQNLLEVALLGKEESLLLPSSFLCFLSLQRRCNLSISRASLSECLKLPSPNISRASLSERLKLPSPNISRELPSLNARSFPLRIYLGELPRQMCSTRLASADNWRPLRTWCHHFRGGSLMSVGSSAAKGGQNPPTQLDFGL